MLSIWLGALLLVIILNICNYFKNWRFYKAINKFPGPTALPLLGNSLDFPKSSHDIFTKIIQLNETYGRFFRVWNNGKAYIISCDKKDAEVLLSSNTHLYKTESYKYFYPWIGNGLISNPDIDNWRKHRKIITPTFHFKILHDFLVIFNKNALILCEELKSKIGKGPFDVYVYVKLAALDNICETSMGIDMSAQRKSDSAYVIATKDIAAVISQRIFKVWLMIDALFNMTKYSIIQKRALEILHGTTNKVIRDAREKFKMNKENNKMVSDDSIGSKKKLTFLHLLLQSEEGSQMSDTELREEVETFMFAGHDTISAGISFALYCLAENPKIQDLAYEEQIEIFGDSNRPPTTTDIQNMKYLERVIKEVQRCYPSIPFIGRALHEDLKLQDYLVPKGTQFCINIFSLHRDPNVWPHPNEFNPDNFLSEAIQRRHPYAFIPFSAGPRNCIGQKYAMLAMKATISTILRHYKILQSPFVKDKPILAAEIILTSTNGLHISLEARC